MTKMVTVAAATAVEIGNVAAFRHALGGPIDVLLVEDSPIHVRHVQQVFAEYKVTN